MVAIIKQSSYYERDVNNNRHKIKERINYAWTRLVGCPLVFLCFIYTERPMKDNALSFFSYFGRFHRIQITLAFMKTPFRY